MQLQTDDVDAVGEKILQHYTGFTLTHTHTHAKPELFLNLLDPGVMGFLMICE